LGSYGSVGGVVRPSGWTGPSIPEAVDQGRYRLWFNGWDGDDGGACRELDEKRPEKTRFHEPAYQGDWIWSYGGDE
jgi:hypothetical protein